MSSSYVYKIEWMRSKWVVFECSDYLTEEIFSSELRSEAEAFVRDLRA